jgi:5-methylcytosine-specific restriction endonuclease McrA
MRREFSPAVRQAALLRAKFRCERCENKHELQLHHMGDPADTSLFNAQVLCINCHTEEHNRRSKYANRYS